MSMQPVTTDSSISPSVVQFVGGMPPVRQFTVDEYHRMIETGILSENDRVELLDGWILEMSPIGPPHATSVSLVAAALQDVLPAGWHLRTQAPITLENGEPEPDVTIVRGGIRDFVTHHPSATDVALLVEVADASLQYDRLQKRPQYAVAGIPEYWIVNLIDRRLEVFRDLAPGGDYQVTDSIPADGTVDLAIDGKLVASLAVADLLP
jgi:Uma2 family endonuclease